MTQYFLGTSLLAQREFLRPPLSFAFFCSTCGEVWGRVWTEGSPWKVHETPCERHQPAGVWDWGRIPGSFVEYVMEVGLGHASLCLDLMPVEVLRREVIIHCNNYEAQYGRDSNTAG